MQRKRKNGNNIKQIEINKKKLILRVEANTRDNIDTDTNSRIPNTIKICYSLYHAFITKMYHNKDQNAHECIYASGTCVMVIKEEQIPIKRELYKS